MVQNRSKTSFAEAEAEDPFDYVGFAGGESSFAAEPSGAFAAEFTPAEPSGFTPGVSESTEAARRLTAAESVLEETRQEAYDKRREQADKAIAQGVITDTMAGVSAGAPFGPIGMVIGLIAGADKSGVELGEKQSTKAVRKDVEKAVAASGAEADVAEAKLERLDVQAEAQEAPAVSKDITALQPLFGAFAKQQKPRF